MKRLLLILLLTTSAAEAKTIEIGERPEGYVNLHIAIAKQWKLLKYNVVLEGNQLSAAAISVVYFKRIGGKICAKPNVRLWFHEGALGTKPNEFYLKQTVKTGWHEPEEFGIGTCPDKRSSKVKVMRCGHFDSYCVFIAGKPGEIGKGIVDTLNSDNISVEVDGDEDGIRAWDENGRL
jgi:hypothetical protein